MQRKHHLMKFSEFFDRYMDKIQNENIKEFFRDNAWNYPFAFVTFARIARLAEIYAPDPILKNEMGVLRKRMEKIRFVKSDIEKVVKTLCKEYPKIAEIEAP